MLGMLGMLGIVSSIMCGPRGWSRTFLAANPLRECPRTWLHRRKYHHLCCTSSRASSSLRTRYQLLNSMHSHGPIRCLRQHHPWQLGCSDRSGRISLRNKFKLGGQNHGLADVCGKPHFFGGFGGFPATETFPNHVQPIINQFCS